MQRKIFPSEASVCFQPIRLIVVVNDVVFDTLIRKPYEKQRYDPKHITNLRFSGIIAKHGVLDTALVYSFLQCLIRRVCSTLGACAILSEFGFLSSSFLSTLNDTSYWLNRFFPFLLSISVSAHIPIHR